MSRRRAFLLCAFPVLSTVTLASGGDAPIYLTQWGSYGTGDGQFNYPGGVATDAAGNVYVADRYNYRVQKFTSDGTYLTQWGTFGSGNGQFHEVDDVATDAAGDVYVADANFRRIQKFTSNGTFLTKWNSPVGAADVATDAAGNVYVSGSFGVEKYTSTGTLITQWGTGGFGNGEFQYADGLTTDALGNVYVADTYNDRIQKFTSDGTYVTQWGTLGSGNGQFYRPYAVAVDSGGTVYVADLNNDRVQMFTSDGTYLEQWGTSGTGNGEFQYAGEVAVDAAGNVFVGDLSNHRIQKFGPSPCVTLDFDTEDDFTTALVNGQHIDTEFGDLVSLTSSGANAGLGIFDSSPGGPNDPSQDLDLLVDTGNVLILQTENFPPNGSDVFPRPNDDSDGGTMIFSFASAVTPGSLRLVDADTDGEANHVVLIDAAGNHRTYVVPSDWTGDRTLAQPGEGTLDLTTLAPQPGFASTATASEDSGFDASLVVSIEVQLAGSGGLDDVSWCTSTPGIARGSAVSRNGSNVNPRTLSNWTRPLIGGTWVTGLDCRAHESGLAHLLVFDAPRTGTLTPFGELLVGGTRVLRISRPHLSSVAFPSLSIPSDIALLGLEVHAQGLCGGSPGPQLSNALDIHLGE